MVIAVIGFFFLVNSPTDVGFESFGEDSSKKDTKGGLQRLAIFLMILCIFWMQAKLKGVVEAPGRRW